MSILWDSIKVIKSKGIVCMRLRLKDMREDKDISQKTLAAYLNIKQNTYSQYENGHRQIPIEVLVKLVRYFDTSVDYLIGETDEKKRYS